MAHTSSGSIFHQVQPQTSQVSPCSGSESLESGHVEPQQEELDAYVFPPVAILGLVVTKVLDHGCRRMIQIAPGWPNLINLSVQIPLSVPRLENLLTQLFNECPNRDLCKLNLHAWHLKPQPFNNKGSLTK